MEQYFGSPISDPLSTNGRENFAAASRFTLKTVTRFARTEQLWLYSPALLKLYPEDFRWSDPPYEYVLDKLPVDVILGDDGVRRDLEQGRSVLDMEKEWQGEVSEFVRKRSRFLLYPS